jgi:hypothetical protein
MKVRPIRSLKVSCHVLTYFGSVEEPGEDMKV